MKFSEETHQGWLPGMEEWLEEELHNHMPDWLTEATIDREAALVRNVALLGGQSRNGYRYTAEAMAAAAPLYEGRPVFVDHAESAIGFRPSAFGQKEGSGGVLPIADSRQPISRSVRDYAGQVVSPRYVEGRVRGDLHLAGPNTAWLLDLIAGTPRDIGMSHVVLARRRPGGEEVEKIEQVLSVDIVAFPATTKSFTESQHPSVPVPAPVPAPDLTTGRSTGTGRGTGAGTERDRLIALLEAFLQREMCDMPVSFERGEPGRVSARSARGAGFARGAHATPLARQALIAAIRGQ